MAKLMKLKAKKMKESALREDPYRFGGRSKYIFKASEIDPEKERRRSSRFKLVHHKIDRADMATGALLGMKAATVILEGLQKEYPHRFKVEQRLARSRTYGKGPLGLTDEEVLEIGRWGGDLRTPLSSTIGKNLVGRRDSGISVASGLAERMKLAFDRRAIAQEKKELFKQQEKIAKHTRLAAGALGGFMVAPSKKTLEKDIRERSKKIEKYEKVKARKSK